MAKRVLKYASSLRKVLEKQERKKKNKIFSKKFKKVLDKERSE